VLEVLREPLESAASPSRAPRTRRIFRALPIGRGDEPMPLRIPRPLQDRVSMHADIVARYRGRISGPLLDRIDLRVTVPALEPDDLARGKPAKARPPCACASSVLACGSSTARERPMRGSKATRPSSAHFRCACTAAPARGAASLMLSARAHHRVLRVARTIADLETRESVNEDHVAEALHYREAARQVRDPIKSFDS
jgi:magnesium chelatase family protein